MLENLKLRKEYDGFLFLAESTRNPPKLKSHHHLELELDLVVRGSVTYVVSGQRFTFPSRTLLWLFPEQEHQLVDWSDDAQHYVAVFKPSLIAKSCRTPAYEGLKQSRHEREGVANTLLEPGSFDLIRRTMDSLMEGSLDPDLLNREAGFGVGSPFVFGHGDPDGLNAGLHHLLLLCWRIQRTGKVLGGAVPLHPAVSRALKLLSESESHHDLATLAKACGQANAISAEPFTANSGSLNPLTQLASAGALLGTIQAPEQKTLAEAVYAAGFDSYAQFYKVFTQAYGHGPRACLER